MDCGPRSADLSAAAAASSAEQAGLRSQVCGPLGGCGCELCGAIWTAVPGLRTSERLRPRALRSYIWTAVPGLRTSERLRPQALRSYRGTAVRGLRTSERLRPRSYIRYITEGLWSHGLQTWSGRACELCGAGIAVGMSAGGPLCELCPGPIHRWCVESGAGLGWVAVSGSADLEAAVEGGVHAWAASEHMCTKM